MTDGIDLPQDNRRSRLPKPTAQVMDEEFVTAWERFAEFRERYPDGYVEATLDRVIEHPDGHVTYVMTAAAYLTRPGFGVMSRPDATGWAQGSTNSENAVVAGSPIESAETIARSKALKNLGILDGTTLRPRNLIPVTKGEDGAELAAARERAGMSQTELAERMHELGHAWSQAVVSRVERGERGIWLQEARELSAVVGFGT